MNKEAHFDVAVVPEKKPSKGGAGSEKKRKGGEGGNDGGATSMPLSDTEGGTDRVRDTEKVGECR